MNAIELDPIAAAAGDVLRNLAGVVAAVLDEPAAGLIPATHSPGEIDAGTAGLKRHRIHHRGPVAVVRNIDLQALEERIVGMVPVIASTQSFSISTIPSGVRRTIDDSRISSIAELKYARMLPSAILFSRSGLIQYSDLL